ncbi:hypothetical protein [uncultured Planktosalinus sp.]|uniref:DUF7793 family protein n=1 Tax=uncultured Planktosalinus sp. TaxID=1810935 RepID=UPI0030DB7AC1|tara:strand:- start:588 stop:968 length:381 start_codon:yes stop_codon:yes gene_type:complete
MSLIQRGKYSDFWVSDGILYFEYHPIPLVDLKIAKAIVGERLDFQEGRSFPILCKTRGIHDANKAARDYLATQGSYLATAVAVLEERLVAQHMLKLYLKANQPLIPTEVFTEEYYAHQFLKPFIKP